MKLPNIKLPRWNLRKLRRFQVWLLLIAALLIIAWIVVDMNMRPIIVNMAEAKVRALAVKAINDAVQSTVSADPDYTDLVEPVTDGEGRITLLKADTLKMNQLSTQATLATQQRLNDIGDQGVSIPLGSITGSHILEGAGPNINVKTIPVGSVTAEFTSEFESAGINQTRHKIYLKVRAEISIVVPSQAKSVEVIVPVLVSENIIVGQVPEYYLHNENPGDSLELVPNP